ncbi:MAG: aminotransferase class IV [Deltaproteobacteria bacterium]|nr:aminotransferase class IV [Deltaproteobacteria bacterium]
MTVQPDLGGVVFINGRLLPAARARVSVFDRGLLYGDGLFETVRTYRGSAFALDDHLARLHASARWLRIPVPQLDWPRQIGALLRRNRLDAGDATVRITLTRGAARPGLLPPRLVRPTLLMTAAAIAPAVARAQRRGVRVALLPFARAGVLAGHKLLDYVPAILGRVIAHRHRAFEGLYVDGEGRLSEGTTCNLFLCRHGRLLTPPLTGGPEVLPGVTRRLVVQLAASAKIAMEERALSVKDLAAADEAFCTSSVIEIVPIIRAGERQVGSGRPGALTRRLQRLYAEIVARAIAA